MAKGGAKILFGLFFFVVLVAGLAGGGAWFLTEHRAEGYQATALVLLDPGPGAARAVTADDSDPLRARIQGALGLDTPTASSPALLSAPDYAVLFESDSMAKRLQEALAPAGQEGAPGMSLEAVKAAMDAETAVALQTRDNVVYQQVIQLHFTADDPARAAAGANTWAAQCVAYAEALRKEQQDARVNALSAVKDKYASELEEARNAQTSLREQSPLEPLELAVKSSSEAIGELKRTVRQAQADSARGDAALKALKAYVEKAPVAVVLELTVTTATTDAEAAGAKAESDFLASQLAGAESEVAQARAAWAEASRNHERVEETIARLAPRVAALEQALLGAAGPGAGARVAAEAVAPEAPVGPHRYAIVAGAAILGAIAGMIVYFGLLTLRVYARELDRS